MWLLPGMQGDCPLLNHTSYQHWGKLEAPQDPSQRISRDQILGLGFIFILYIDPPPTFELRVYTMYEECTPLFLIIEKS